MESVAAYCNFLPPRKEIFLSCLGLYRYGLCFMFCLSLTEIRNGRVPINQRLIHSRYDSNTSTLVLVQQTGTEMTGQNGLAIFLLALRVLDTMQGQ